MFGAKCVLIGSDSSFVTAQSSHTKAFEPMHTAQVSSEDLELVVDGSGVELYKFEDTGVTVDNLHPFFESHCHARKVLQVICVRFPMPSCFVSVANCFPNPSPIHADNCVQHKNMKEVQFV